MLVEHELSQMPQAIQMTQPSVAHLCQTKLQRLKIRQLSQVLQAVVGHVSVFEIEFRKLGQSSNMFQTPVTDYSASE